MKTILILLIQSILFLGCQTTGSVKVRSYKTLKSVQTAQVAAMEIYRDLSLAGEIDADTRAKVKEAYEDYQKVFDVAITAARFDYASAPPMSVIDKLTELVTMIEAL